MPPEIECVSDLRELRWTDDAVVADFVVHGEEQHVLRVQFTNQVIIRILDEMPLSTESESTPKEGLIPYHFAYRVEGATFETTQSETWKFTQQPATHYRFVTGWTCLDVLSAKGTDLSGCQANADFNVRLKTGKGFEDTEKPRQKHKTRLGGGSSAQISTMGKYIAWLPSPGQRV